MVNFTLHTSVLLVCFIVACVGHVKESELRDYAQECCSTLCGTEKTQRLHSLLSIYATSPSANPELVHFATRVVEGLQCIEKTTQSATTKTYESDWPVFGGDPAHTAFKNVSVFGSVKAARGYTKAWSTQLVADLTYGVVYENVYIVAGQETVFMLNANTGEKLRSFSVGGSSYLGPPIVGFGTIFVQTIGEDEGILVTAYELASGDEVWTASGDSQWATYPYGTTPGALLYVPGGEYNGEMYALDPMTGNTSFNAELYKTGAGDDWWAPTVYDGRVFFNTNNGEGSDAQFGEVDAKSGEVLWSLGLQSSWDGYSTYWVPAISQGIAFVLGRNNGILNLSAIDVSSRKSIWSHSCAMPAPFHSNTFRDFSPATDATNVFLTCANAVRAFQVETGKPTYVYACSQCTGQPIITRDVVIVTNGTNTVVFDKTSANFPPVEIPDSGHIAIYGGLLFVTNNDTVSAYALA